MVSGQQHEGQRGPVESGSRPGPVPMDVDRALNVLEHCADPHNQRQADEIADSAAALRTVLNTARAYVRGPSSGRLEALAAALQEPVGAAVAPVDVDAVVQAYMTERNMIAIRRETARALGVFVPEDLHGR